MRGKKWCGEVSVLGKPAERYLFSLEEVIFTWGIHMYQRLWQNISEEAPREYFGSSRVFFPSHKCHSICHRATGSNSLASPVKGASQKLCVCCWDIRRRMPCECVARGSSVPFWGRVYREKTSQLRRYIFLPIY